MAQPAKGTTLASAASGLDLATVKKGWFGPNVALHSSSLRHRRRSLHRLCWPFILHELLELGIAVHHLVRAGGVDHGMHRLVDALVAAVVIHELLEVRLCAVAQPGDC